MQLQQTLQELKDEKFDVLIEYARQMFREDGAVRLEQAGNVTSRTITIRNVYTDLEAQTQSGDERDITAIAAHIIDLGNRLHRRRPAAYATEEERFLNSQPPDNNIVLLGNAGQGKSTLCQYICQIYRAALLRRFGKNEPETAEYFSLEAGLVPKCERFPVLISLKRYAAWISRQEAEQNSSVLSYILAQVKGKASADFSLPQLRHLLSGYSWVFLFDGLDEVPASSNRSEVLKRIQEFLGKDLVGSRCDSIVICTSRPQGYDDAFSERQYDHYRLKDMSKKLCEQYIERLLIYLEDNSDIRDTYRKTLRNALKDPMVSKLMTTPLYTAIIVLLVKMGGTPPTKRYALFQEYCDIVVKREKQKGILPTLNDEYDWIKRLHAQIGFLLQAESGSVKNAAAELSAARCKEVITAFLQAEAYEGDIPAKAEDLYSSITNRLSFLSEAVGTDQETCVLFPLRSIQEYFAAEWLISFDDENKLTEALELISTSTYWRNVYLFVAGFYAKNRHFKNVNDELYLICRRNNGDDHVEDSDEAAGDDTFVNACRISMQGSQLALELLCDNLFSYPKEQQRYMDIAARLLKADWERVDLADQLLRLPAKISDIFIKKYVIPHLQTPNAMGDTVFEYLWIMAAGGQAEAARYLEEAADTMPVPSVSSIQQIIDGGYYTVSDDLMHKLYAWITEDHFTDFCQEYLYNNEYWKFLSQYYTRFPDTKLTAKALRQIVYELIGENNNGEGMKKLVCPHPLVCRIQMSDELRQFSALRTFGKYDVAFRPICCDGAALPLLEFAEDFKAYGLDELVALTAFLQFPTAAALKVMLDAYAALPAEVQVSFAGLIRNWNWLLKEVADALCSDRDQTDIRAHFTEDYVNACRQKDCELRAMAQNDDLIAITKAGYFDGIGIKVPAVLPPEYIKKWIRSITENGVPVTGALLAALCHQADYQIRYLPPEDTDAELQEMLQEIALQHFPLLFQTMNGVSYAFQLFLQLPVKELLKADLTYPDGTGASWMTCHLSEAQITEIFRKIDFLADFGGNFLQAYALVPYLCWSARSLSKAVLPADKLIPVYEELQRSGNLAAQAGCLVRILAGQVAEKERPIVEEALLKIIYEKNFNWILAVAGFSFSLQGKEIVFEVFDRLRGTEKEKPGFLAQYGAEILAGLQAAPIDRDKLIYLANAAHSS